MPSINVVLLTQVYLYISTGKKVVGCVFAEKISQVCVCVLCVCVCVCVCVCARAHTLYMYNRNESTSENYVFSF